ncbi:Abi family protein, partial [Paraeggerthella hominis]|uniref:Abi family protein n=1 Tax=Paraeggerthella hominis TaxID=2897351 RepID=UPI003D0E6CA0
MEYTKPFLTFEQQADLLMKDRGMIADRDSLIRHLQDVGYYRLSGYWHIHKMRDSGKFWEGTTFQRVWETYVFDRQFRLVVLDAVERIEIYMRTQLAYILAELTGPFGFLDKKSLPRLNADT